MQSKTDKIDNADMALVQNDSEDDSDYKENEKEDESNSREMEVGTDEASYNAGSTTNAGWADVMQKILKTNKPKGKKTLVLAKAKKLCDIKIKEKKDISFDIDGIKDDIKTESEEAIDKRNVTLISTSRRITKTNGIRIKPSITNREHEKMLQKIATKGVVQLFNAVKHQQVEIKKKLSQAGPLERKREQVFRDINKNAFLDILMSDSKSIPVDNAVKSEKPVQQTDKNKDHKMWSVLRDDFVMGAKLKDWDKKNVEEENSSSPEDINSDMD